MTPSMEKRPKLTVRKRKIFGKKVKKLRKKGLIPAHIFGRKIKSLHISVAEKDFLPVFEEVGETGLLDLVVEKGKARTVLISQVQRHPITEQILHIDFHQVDLKEKVKAEIPIEIKGTAPAVEEKKGVLLTILDKIEVEALPTDLPETIPVDVSSLKEVDDAITVGDVKIGKKVTLLADPEEVLVKIGPLVTAEMKEEIKAEEEAKAEAEKAKEEEKKEETKEEEEKKQESSQKESS